MEAKNILDVERFVIECNDMLGGKFFDLNKRLEKFLSVMTKSEDLLDFLSDCLQEFDEEEEFAKAFSVDKKTGSVKVAIPADDKKRLALSVTIFNDLTCDKLNSTQFLETYFKDKNLTPMQNFLEKIIRPYRDLVCKYFEVSKNISLEDIKRQLEEERVLKEQEKKQAEKEAEEAQFPYLDELLEEVEKTCNQILSMLKFEKKRTDVLDDVEFVVGSIIKACEKRDLMVVNGLVIGLNYVSKKFKSIRSFVTDLNNSIYGYYEYLGQGASAEESAKDEIADAEETDEE